MSSLNSDDDSDEESDDEDDDDDPDNFEDKTAKSIPRGAGDSHMKQTGMIVGNFEFNP